MDANASPAIRNIRLQEGMRHKFESGVYPPRTLFLLTAGCSTMLGGKPVRRAAFLLRVPPLVHLRRMQAGKAAVRPSQSLTY